MSELVVGCPVSHREWVLPHWFDAVEAACAVAGVEPQFVFVGDRRDPSFAVIDERAPDAIVEEVVDDRPSDLRRWRPERYRRMVVLRNLLLGRVRQLEPAYFLSLDSDILLHPGVLCLALEDLEAYDVVGLRCYMTEHGTSAPSCGQISRQGTLQRRDTFGVVQVGVVMAAKVMSPAAYGVDYRFDMEGEDIGWSKACAETGLRFGWEGRLVSKHVLHPAMLHRVDPRVGF